MKWFNMLPEQRFVLPKDVVCGQQLDAPCCYLGMFILVMTKLVLRRAQRKLRTSLADTLPLMIDSSSSCADFFVRDVPSTVLCNELLSCTIRE